MCDSLFQQTAVVELCWGSGRARGTNRSTGAAWPRPPSASAGGRSAAACPAGPEPLDSPGAGSLIG